MRGLGGSRVPGLKHPRAPVGVVVEQGQGAAGRQAGGQITSIVLLEGAWAAADQLAGPGLVRPQLLADAPDLLGLQRRFPRLVKWFGRPGTVRRATRAMGRCGGSMIKILQAGSFIQCNGIPIDKPPQSGIFVGEGRLFRPARNIDREMGSGAFTRGRGVGGRARPRGELTEGAVGHARVTAALGAVSHWLTRAAMEHGVDIAGFRYTIDGSAVRHILGGHGDAASEARRGQIAITATDFQALPYMLSSPDRIAFGAKGKTGLDHVTIVKSMGDGSLLVIEEARRGRMQLALLSMRKYPAAIDADRLPRLVDPNVRSDGGDAPKIVEPPAGASAIDGDGRFSPGNGPDGA